MFQGVYSQKEIYDKIVQFRNKDKKEGSKKKKGDKKVYHVDCASIMLYRDQYWLESLFPWMPWDKKELIRQIDLAEEQYDCLPLTEKSADEAKNSDLCASCKKSESFWYENLGTIKEMRTCEGWLFKLCPQCESRMLADPQEKHCLKCDSK